MIKYEWRTGLSQLEAAELADMLQRAAAYDAEPGYSSIDFADVSRSMGAAESPDNHLLIWMLPHATALAEPSTPERIAGLLRLTSVLPGVAQATAVIDPRLRSLGIMTLLLETVGLDTTGPGGWLGTGAHTVTSWARGNHPATGRLSNRFLIPRTRRVWQLIRSTEPQGMVSSAPVLEPISNNALAELSWHTAPDSAGLSYALRQSGRVVGVATVGRQAVASEEFGDCVTLESVRVAPPAATDVVRPLLEGVAVIAHEAGLPGLIIHVDSDDTGLVNACRRAGFQHDRTDVRYQLGGSS